MLDYEHYFLIKALLKFFLNVLATQRLARLPMGHMTLTAINYELFGWSDGCYRYAMHAAKMEELPPNGSAIITKHICKHVDVNFTLRVYSFNIIKRDKSRSQYDQRCKKSNVLGACHPVNVVNNLRDSS